MRTTRTTRKGAGSGEASGSSVVSLERGLDILRAFRSEAQLGNKEIAQRTGLPKATVARLTYTLTRLGYLRQAGPLGQYHLDEKVAVLGNAFLRNLPIREVARPLMEALADEHDVSVALAAPERTGMVYIEYCRSPETVTVSLRVGSVLPMGRSAIGRAYLWGLPPDQRARRLEALEAEAGDEAPALRSAIEETFSEFERHGFALSLGTWRREIYAIAAPVWVDRGQTVLALNCALKRRGNAEQLLRTLLGPALVTLATEIAEGMDRLGRTYWGD